MELRLLLHRHLTEPMVASVRLAKQSASIRLWAVARGTKRARWQVHEAGVSALAFQSDSGTLISGDAHVMLKVWPLVRIRQELTDLGLHW